MKNILATIVICLTLIVGNSQDALLTLSSRNSCLKEVVSTFVREDDCSHLSDTSKAKLAMKMTECLLKEMGKRFPEECRNSLPGDCRLEGDAWNTFSTFFSHIDNLCHFYWQTLHHQRAQRLIGQLSESSSKAEEVLRDNTLQTQKVLSMQQTMQSTLGESLKQQQEMASLINSSTARINNLTLQVELFAEKIRADIEGNYASLSRVLAVMSGGLERVLEIQGYLKAQITSISGMLLCLGQFLLILFVTSFKKYNQNRNTLLTLLGLQVGLQILFPSVMETFVSIRTIRSIFMVVMGLVLLINGDREEGLQGVINNRLSTPRLEKVIRRAVEEHNWQWAKRNWLSSQEAEWQESRESIRGGRGARRASE